MLRLTLVIALLVLVLATAANSLRPVELYQPSETLPAFVGLAP